MKIREEIEMMISRYDVIRRETGEQVARIHRRKQGWACASSILSPLECIFVIMAASMWTLQLYLPKPEYPQELLIMRTIITALAIGLCIVLTKAPDWLGLTREEPPSEWFDAYDAIKRSLKLMDANDMRYTETDEGPQYFTPQFSLQANCEIGTFGKIALQSHKAPFMTSIYGKGKPSSQIEKSKIIPLKGIEAVQAWKAIPDFDCAELPYIKIRLFRAGTLGVFELGPRIYLPSPYHCWVSKKSVFDKPDEWKYLIPRTENLEEVKEAFETVCRLIVYDIIRKKLTDIMDKNSSEVLKAGIISAGDVAPYFTGKNKDGEPEELRKAFERLEEIVQPAIEASTTEMRIMDKMLAGGKE